MNKKDKDDAIRIIGGGPGSGKSSFAKMFAASISFTHDVLFIPLYKLDINRDVEDVVGKYFVSNRIFRESPIGKSEQLLLIFDGLDEITQQGKAGLDAASDFITQIKQLVLNYNQAKLRIRVIITVTYQCKRSKHISRKTGKSFVFCLIMFLKHPFGIAVVRCIQTQTTC